MARHPSCKCEEARVGGDRLANDTHDCDYVEARNKLMGAAAKRADAACESAAKNAKWFREFHKAMNELAYETGLTTSPPRPEGVVFVSPVKLKQLKLKKFGS